MVAGMVGDPSPVAVALAPPPGGAPRSLSSKRLASSAARTDADCRSGRRIATFLDGFPGRSKRTSICDPDLTGALAEIGHSTKQLVGDPCLDTTNLADSSSRPASSRHARSRHSRLRTRRADFVGSVRRRLDRLLRDRE